MLKSNRKLLSRAEQIQKMIALPTISLEAEEADRFIDYVVDESVLKDNARIVKMDKETKNIRALGFGSGRFLKPAATFSQSDYKKEWAHNKIALKTEKVRGCVVVFDDDLEDGIEGNAFKEHLLRIVASKIATELDEAAWISDTHNVGAFGADDIRSLWDGWRYQITHSGNGQDYENKVSGSAVILDATADFDLAGKIAEQDAEPPYNWEFKYAKIFKRLASKYKKVGLANMRYWESDQVTMDYVNALSARSTILGDQAIMGATAMKYGKVPIVDCPLMPTTLDLNGVLDGGNFTDVLLTPAENLIIGIHRKLTLESQREAADEATYFFYSMRADFRIENVNACVLCKKLTIG